MKTLKYILLGALLAIGIPVFAVNISVPSAPSAGYGLVSTSAGNYNATTTTPWHVGSIFASSTTDTSYFAGNVAIGATLTPTANLLISGNNLSGTTAQTDIVLSRYHASDSDTREAAIMELVTSNVDYLAFGVSGGQAGNSAKANQTSRVKMVISEFGNVGIATSSPYAALSVVGSTGVVADHYFATSTTNISTFAGGFLAAASSTIGSGTQVGGLTVNGGATSTLRLNVLPVGTAIATAGLKIGDGATGGIAVGDGILSKSAGSLWVMQGINLGGGSAAVVAASFGTLNTGLFGDATSINFSIAGVNKGGFASTGAFGIATTSPFAKLSIHGNPNDTTLHTMLFAIGSSTATATTTLFSVNNMGSTTIGNFGNCTGSSALNTVNGTIVCGLVSGSGSASTTLLVDVNNWSGLQKFASNVNIGTTTGTDKLDIVGAYPAFKVFNTDASQYAGAGFYLINQTASMGSQAGTSFYAGINDGSATQGYFAFDRTNSTGGGTGHNMLFDYNANTIAMYPDAVTPTLTVTTAGVTLGTDMKLSQNASGYFQVQRGSGQHTLIDCEAPAADPQECTLSLVRTLSAGNREFTDYTQESYGNLDNLASVNVAKQGTGVIRPFGIRFWDQDLGLVHAAGKFQLLMDPSGATAIGDYSTTTGQATNKYSKTVALQVSSSTAATLFQVNAGLNSNVPVSRFTVLGSGLTGVSSSSPFAKLSVHANPSDTYTSTLFAIASSSLTATTTLFSINNRGNMVLNGQYANTIASSSLAAANYTVNWDSGNTQRFILNQNSTFIINATSSNPLDGAKYVLKLCQDGTGSRTATFVTPGQLRWGPNGTTSVLATANSATWIGMVYDSLTQRYDVLASTTITNSCN